MSFTYTSSNEPEIRRIEEGLRGAGVRFKKVQTEARTYTDGGQVVTVGTARPWNITVSTKHAETLQQLIAEQHQGQGK
jgi:hypothetical protein